MTSGTYDPHRGPLSGLFMVLAVIPSIINWTRYVAVVLMVPVFILLFAAYLPGEIKAKVKHPFPSPSRPGCLPI